MAAKNAGLPPGRMTTRAEADFVRRSMADVYLTVNEEGKSRRTDGMRAATSQWQVLQDLDEQLWQPEEEALRRLEPPPMPKPEILLRTSADPHPGQTASFSLPTATRHSNLRPHFLHSNS